MTTDEVKVIMDRICDEAHCPTVSFTGGEPTLRDDLPELIAYAREQGTARQPDHQRHPLRRSGLCASLAEAGLDSAQVSLEGGSAAVHDAITQHPGSWARTVQGVRNLRAAQVHTHTNTTICGGNRGAPGRAGRLYRRRIWAPSTFR